MRANLHHAHIFANDIDASVAWWREMLLGEVVYDGEFGGVRNVFMRVGYGRLNIYDQPPPSEARNAVHHLGIQCEDLAGLRAHMEGRGVAFRGAIREFGAWRYLMCAAPDNVLLELFEVDAALEPAAVREYLAGR
jgi:hypothetical protein